MIEPLSGPGGTVLPARAADVPWWRSPRVCRDLSVLVLLAAGIICLLTFQDYGITHDEEVQNNYGKMILSYYTSGFQDRSNFDYLDLYRYGGLFDLLAVIANLVSPLGEYETRHLLGGLFGVFGLIGAWRLGRHLGGERAGLLALLILLLEPAYYGQSFNNPKDAPFAGAMIWCVLYLCRAIAELPHIRLRTALKLGVAFGLALGIRVGALLVVPYVGLGLVIYFLLEYRRYRVWRIAGAELWDIVKHLGLALVVAYALMAVLWPWAVQSPINPVRALLEFSRLPLNLDTLVAGKWVKAYDLPYYYLPVYLVSKMPETVLFGLLLALGYSTVWLVRGHPRTAAEERKAIQYLEIGLAAGFPILFFVLTRPTAYNGIRHFLFVMPPMAVLAGLAIDHLWTDAERRVAPLGRALALVLTAVMVVQTWTMVRLHPDEYIYFNMLVGGVHGAEDEYELDYWSNSLHEAAGDLANFIQMETGEGKPVTQVYKVAVCGHKLSAAYYFPPYMFFTKKLDEADFLIAFTQANCDEKFAGRTIISVERMGATLSVVKDLRELKAERQRKAEAKAQIGGAAPAHGKP